MKNLVIDKRVIRENLRIIKENADGASIIADLSANAGGMGLFDVASLLRDEGVSAFAVSDLNDAATLRFKGFQEERIMMLQSTADPADLKELIALDVICTCGSYDAAVAINGIAEAKKMKTQVQIKVDTGLGRYGFLPAETDRIAAIYKYMSWLEVIGTFTTFSASWKSSKQTLRQLDVFNDVLDKLTAMGLEPGIAHCCDSAALFRFDFAHMDAVRVDTALSGRVPGKAITGLGRVGYIECGLEEVRWVPKGHRYGAERPIVTRAPTKIAVLSVGSYHGFGVTRHVSTMSIPELLAASSRPLYVRVNGQKARVLGNVGLLHTLIDVTKIECTVGDPAILDVDPVNVKGLPILYKE
jgi:alanine racemase